MNLQEQEEMEFQFGRANDFQNAYALSQIERRQDDPQIEVELAKGKFVVIGWNEQYCPFTDAALPSWKSFISSHDTYEEATAQPEQHSDQMVLCHPLLRVPVVVESTEDIPF